MRSLECFNPHRKLISKPDQAVSQSINKKFLIWLTGERESNDIYTNVNVRTGTRHHQGIPQSEEKETVTGKRDGNPDSDLSEDSGLAALELWRLPEVWLGYKVERTIWPYCERYRRVTGERPVRNQLITHNPIPALSAVLHSFHDSKIALLLSD